MLGQRKSAVVNGQKDLSHLAVGALTRSGRPFCTGTLITPQLVLTAAHCVDDIRNPSGYQFRIDEPSADGKTVTRTGFDIQQAVANPAYRGSSNYAEDVAVLILKKKVPARIVPIPINRKALEPTLIGKTVRVVGYGYIQTKPRYISTNDKHAADIPLFQIDPKYIIHFESQVERTKRKSACHGDSGGPSLLQIDGKLHVVGITSVAYQATYGGRLTYCDGGAISTRPDAHLSFLDRYIKRYSGKPLPCTADKDCLSCSVCDTAKKLCTPKPINEKNTTCKPCETDADCGLGICEKTIKGYRCRQPCAAGGCCPSGSYCESRKGTNKSVNVCVPDSVICPALKCQQKSDCGPGEDCVKGFCEVQRPTPTPSLCRSCYTSAQCGKGNICLDATSPLAYCVQACGEGGYCPTGFSCKQIGPGVRQCVPDGNCFVPCKEDKNCPNDYICRKERCVRKTGGLDGDFCDAISPCNKQSGYQCVRDDARISRCVSQCGPVAGAGGMRCNSANPTCDKGLKCTRLFSGSQVCMESCSPGGSNQCKQGGQCYQLTRTFSGCFCNDDNDCNIGQTCNRGSFGFLGVCANQPLRPRTCKNGLACSPIAPEGNFCAPRKGDRTEGTACSRFQTCRAGTSCLQLSRDMDATCMRRCSGPADCINGGQCTNLGRAGRYCLCTSRSQCGNKRECSFIFTSGLTRYGICSVDKNSTCSKDAECPVEHRCDAGKCVFDPSKQNEPFQQPKEAIAEQTTPDAGTQESTPDTADTAPETQPESKSIDEQQPEPTGNETKGTDKPKDTDSAPQKPKVSLGGGCGCQSQRNTPTPLYWSLSLLLLGLVGRRRSRS